MTLKKLEWILKSLKIETEYSEDSYCIIFWINDNYFLSGFSAGGDLWYEDITGSRYFPSSVADMLLDCKRA